MRNTRRDGAGHGVPTSAGGGATPLAAATTSVLADVGMRRSQLCARDDAHLAQQTLGKTVDEFCCCVV